ncbi:hypothetical protein Ddye_027291 [Dipteronia dyeriana]|uniref:PGG domain-containing protein n=1 Tax=Dipteronia dyeriana TaxID=168575 RepID=A0AAD9WQC2_9ROSI|nr:hypothetical protein Ddye_027291 [Dipteronia dyeriana]
MDRKLFEAISHRDTDQIKKLEVENHDILKGRTLDGNTALHLAARLGDIRVIKLILRHEPSFLYEKNGNGETPMHIAAKAGNAYMIEIFVEHDRNRNVGQGNILWLTDKQHNTPLHNAVMNHHSLAAVLLMNNDSGTIPSMNDAKQSPISIAIDTSSTSYHISSTYIVWFMIKEHLSSHDYRGPNELTFLHCAVIRQHYVLVVEILKANKNLINKIDEYGRNPLHYAAGLGNKAIASQLLEADVSLSLGYKADCKGQTPLHLAAENGQKIIFTMLVNGYPDAIVGVDRRQRSILHLAARNGYESTVKFILTFPDTEYLLNSPDVDGNTPLHLAAMNFHKEVVHVLSKNKKVNIRATNLNQQTALAIVESSTDPKRDIQKQYLIVKILKEAIKARALYPEDILQDERRFHDMERDARQIRDREMAQTLLVMATLIVTFTFTGVFTIPGGYVEEGPNEGMAKLVNKSGFKAFVISITIAMTSSVTGAALVLMQILHGNGQFYMNLIPLAIRLVWLGLVSMSMAFMTGLFVVLSNKMDLAIVAVGIGCAFPLLPSVLRLFFRVQTYEITSKKYFYGLFVLLLFFSVPISVSLPLLSLLCYLLGRFWFQSAEFYHLRLSCYNKRVKLPLEHGFLLFLLPLIYWSPIPITLFPLLVCCYLFGLYRAELYLSLRCYDKMVKLSLKYGLHRHTTLRLFLIIPIVLAKMVCGRISQHHSTRN